MQVDLFHRVISQTTRNFLMIYGVKFINKL